MLKVVTTQGLRNSKLYHAMKPNYFYGNGGKGFYVSQRKNFKKWIEILQ